MEPDVIRLYSSSPPPLEDAGAEEEDDEFGDFGTFSAVAGSVSFTEFDTPTTFNQNQALTATSPPEILNNRALAGFGRELPKANGVVVAPSGPAPSDRTEVKKAALVSGGTVGSELADCNGGGGAEVLTNGFATFDVQGSPSSQNSVHSHVKGTASGEDTGSSGAACSPQDDFADFAAFSGADGPVGSPADRDQDQDQDLEQRCAAAAEGTTSEDEVRDTNRTGPVSVAAAAAEAAVDRDAQQRDAAAASAQDAETVCTNEPLPPPPPPPPVDEADGDESKDAAAPGCCGEHDEHELSPDGGTAADSEAGQSDETETETETSLGRPLSTDALEEYGDVSTTGSAPSPPLQGDNTATPADHSQLAEDEDDEDFGDFGDVGSFGAQGFADFEPPEQNGAQDSAARVEDEDDDFGDFNSPKRHAGGGGGGGGGGDEAFADFPVSDSFGNFSSAAGGGADGTEEEDAGWSAFGEQPAGEGQGEGEESWAAFSTEPSGGAGGLGESRGGREGEEEEEQQEEEEPAAREETTRTDRQTVSQVSLSSRLEKLFHSSFPPAAAAAAAPVEEQVVSLQILLEPRPHRGQEGEGPPSTRAVVCGGGGGGGGGSVWTQLQDIHEALGLRYQWGGSHCNKALLCCLGIDTRNILFTGQKKQPVIVPMYAASLGMLEPTKEPVKPVSAAEMIASIAQAPPPAPEKTSCPPDPVQQEALPPVQFDWSSSGLTNPLDASGGSSLLNLDFFGPVEDSGSSSSTSIPGVDPELYELTTAKLDPGGGGSRVADAFARLMSTMEKTSTSTRKPRKDENLSEEAAKVIAALPDLSFMTAKVLMFPATLTPLSSQTPLSSSD